MNNKIDKTDDLILNEFKSLPDDSWDFKDSKTDELIHGLHNYPAVMIYPISRQIIKVISKHKDINCLFDPFVGSGTVIVEGQMASIPTVIGNDLNPLALLISKAKTTLLSERDIHDFKRCTNIISEKIEKNLTIFYDFENFVKSRCSIEEKQEWANNPKVLFNEYFEKKQIDIDFPDFKNMGYWFIPSVVLCLGIIKKEISKIKNKKIIPLVNCSFSEFIRYTSNTRNGEFKLYRIPKDKVRNLQFDLVKEFNNIFNKNINKMEEYMRFVNENTTNIYINSENTMDLVNIKDNTVDLVITSPPYGDSKTTVAYGQFSRLSSQWLGLIDDNNIDSMLLGGRNRHFDIQELESETLIEIVSKIKSIYNKRADEVANFYYDLDKSIKAISKKTVKGGYHFWVVGNRTVKNTIIMTDKILIELAKKYGLLNIANFYRKISNKVMPSKNSPTNVAGKVVPTMQNETIVVFKKV